MAKTHNADINRNLVLDGLTGEQRQSVAEKYTRALSDVTYRVWKKTGLDRAEVQDLAAAAMMYALRSYVNGTRPWPRSWKDWANQATWKANNLALDLIARTKCTPMVYFDEEPLSEEGEPLAESGATVQASVQAWRNQQAEEERRCRRAAVRYAVPKVVHDMGTKNELRTLSIVKAVYYHQLPVAEICQRFEGLNRNHLYQILFRFREHFAEVGQGYMDEFLDHYSDSVLLAG